MLRVDPPNWDEPGVISEVTVGKSCARLDLRDAAGRAVFERLLAEADMLVHGYRPGALEALGFDPARRRAIQPRVLEVTLDAYGWTRPWRMRRGMPPDANAARGLPAHAA